MVPDLEAIGFFFFFFFFFFLFFFFVVLAQLRIACRFKVGQLSIDTYRAKEKGPKSKLLELEKTISDLLMLINATKASEVGVSVGGLKVFGFGLGFSKIQPPLKSQTEIATIFPDIEKKPPAPVAAQEASFPVVPPPQVSVPPPPAMYLNLHRHRLHLHLHHHRLLLPRLVCR